MAFFLNPTIPLPRPLRFTSGSSKPVIAFRSYSFSDASSAEPSGSAKSEFTDEWGEKSEPEPEPKLRFPDPDPPKIVDEWEASGVEPSSSNGSPGAVDDNSSNSKKDEEDLLLELKRALVDTVYGSDLGFRASAEIRAEALELVSQLEAVNPTPAPTEAAALLDGNWILVFTAFSELLPLLAVNAIPSVKVERIVQSIDTNSLAIENSATISTPLSTSSFTSSASFEVRTPFRIQVQFKEATFKPPEIKSRIDLPGQNINLQQILAPLEGGLENLARIVSGLSPLTVPVPRTSSWLLITYLDEDVRISRGDGGLFVLVKEGSSLLS
ncbi:hypothetical protein M569_04771 [Genlisea aurea]|uniref:Plastid lipid-associated protein/fibrillin conserved domain-containing protein n=1 Tax=Genlisea aurea TaxID=192259 RepID=S8CYA5_9LAMI|nr:hypothetical protein M569_04771 [Genlisea aurea]